MKINKMGVIKMKILIGTKNPGKIEGAKQAFEKYFDEVEIEGISVDSNVGDQPVNEEILQGAKNRVKNLKKYAGYWEIVKLLDELKTQNRVRNVEIGAFEEECPVCSFLYNLRNSLCHEGIGFLPFQIDFKGKPQNKIDNIIFQAKKTKDTSNVQFIAVLSVAQLEYLLTNVATMYINVENGKRTSSEREYIDFYHELQKNVKNYLPKFRPY